MHWENRIFIHNMKRILRLFDIKCDRLENNMKIICKRIWIRALVVVQNQIVGRVGRPDTTPLYCLCIHTGQFPVAWIPAGGCTCSRSELRPTAECLRAILICFCLISLTIENEFLGFITNTSCRIQKLKILISPARPIYRFRRTRLRNPVENHKLAINRDDVRWWTTRVSAAGL